MHFSDLGLSDPILQAVTDKGYNTPSPIQAQAIPAVIKGRDVMAAAQTGTGKTAGFTLPLLERLSTGKKASPNHVRALVLTPTRELAAQVAESVATYGKYLSLKSTVVFGGVKINPQMMKLRGGVDVLIATPGRLLDLYQQNAVKFDELDVLILDEADRMLDMGFIHDIRRILKALPSKRQNLMFSATFSDDIRELAKTIVNDPIEISVTPKNSTAKTVKQWIHPVDKKQKPALLLELINHNQWEQVLVFSRTKHGANKLATFLDKNNVKAAAIHGNKSQGARTRALAEFKSGKVRVLVATDIAARGLDIEQLPQVVNVDLPNVPEDYVHRIGRTGRAGATGQAISLVSADEIQQLSDIERLIQKLLPRELVDGFEPIHDVPESRLRPPARPKKPKKSRPTDSNNADHRNKRGQNTRGNRSSQAKGTNKGANTKSRRNNTASTHNGPTAKKPSRRS
ncbi:DEAD/DEAH box helicase [Eionea flava]